MRTIELTKEQQNKVFKELRNIEPEGSFEIEVDIDNLTINVQGWLEVDYRVEYDRLNLNPPEYIETYRSSGIDSVTAEIYDDDADKYEPVELTEAFVKECEDYIY